VAGGPSARFYPSLGQRPRYSPAGGARAKSPSHRHRFAPMGRAFSPWDFSVAVLGRCPRLVWSAPLALKPATSPQMSETSFVKFEFTFITLLIAISKPPFALVKSRFALAELSFSLVRFLITFIRLSFTLAKFLLAYMGFALDRTSTNENFILVTKYSMT
jgi:hypothetical protein